MCGRSNLLLSGFWPWQKDITMASAGCTGAQTGTPRVCTWSSTPPPVGGGGGLLWDGKEAKRRGDAPLFFWAHRWTKLHEVILGAKIGDPGSQAIWEAFAMFISIQLWVSEERPGPIVVVGDAEGSVT